MTAVDLARDVSHGWSAKNAAADSEWLAVSPLLGDLLPQGLRRCTTVAVTSHSLLLALIATPTQNGSWVAIAGISSVGVMAATELGVRLGRCAFVPHLGRDWPVTIASLIDAVDVVVLHASQNVKPSDARRLVARARQQGCVLVLCKTPWPEQPSVELRAERCQWNGIDGRYGHFTGCEINVATSGRGMFSQPRRSAVCLGETPPSSSLRVVAERVS